MDTSAIAALATEMATVRTVQAAQIAVLKKAMELQGQGAIELVTSAARSGNNPPQLGGGVDTYA